MLRGSAKTVERSIRLRAAMIGGAVERLFMGTVCQRLDREIFPCMTDHPPVEKHDDRCMTKSIANQEMES